MAKVEKHKKDGREGIEVIDTKTLGGLMGPGYGSIPSTTHKQRGALLFLIAVYCVSIFGPRLTA